MSRPGSILGLTTQEKEEACQGYEHRTTLQIMEAWKEKKINNATYWNLIKEACKDKQAKVVMKVREILTGGHILENKDMKMFHEYLYECYTRELPHPSHTQWPQLLHHELYVDQVLYRKQESRTPLQSDQIFNDPSGKVVLIEGVAGSGKSTLLWHICKQWALGNLFRDFSLVIHTSLLNWEYDIIRNLADIIPHPLERLRNSVADIIIKDHGRRICFLIDDCSKGALKRISIMLPQCMFLVTSRPSMNSHLNNIPHDEITLKGCISGDFFDTLLHDDVEGRERISHLLELKPELRALCELPLNAVILIFIHKMLKEDDRHMPVTRTNLFSLMLLNFLLRHIHQQEEHEDAMIENLEEDLPPEIHQNLVRHCRLAYNSISENKTIMSRRELKELGISEKPDETLGLLQITRSVTVFGQDTHYSFPHLQDFLAALHIQWMRDEDGEASAIQKLMDNDPLDPVITFYAGLTKLKNKKVQDILMAVQNILQDPLSAFTITDTHEIAGDNGWKHLALLNSIYESQDRDLVKIYTPKILENRVPRHVPDFQIPWDAFLNFAFLPLYPSDFLSLAYYSRIKVRSMKKESLLNIALSLCSFTDVGLETFSNEISKGNGEVTPGNLSLVLTGNPIITDSAHTSITTLLSSGKIAALCLHSCMLPDTVSTTLKCIIDGLNNSLLDDLALINSHINITHVDYLIHLVCMNSNLCDLSLTGNDLKEAIPPLSSALIHSKIIRIHLEDCNIDDDGLYCLFEVMRHRSLMLINIDGNPQITTLGLNKCLSLLLEEEHSRPTLDNLLLSTESLLNEENKIIIGKINSLRSNSNVPPLYVGNGIYKNIDDKRTNRERENMYFAANNKELGIKLFSEFLRVRYNSRSAY